MYTQSDQADPKKRAAYPGRWMGTLGMPLTNWTKRRV